MTIVEIAWNEGAELASDRVDRGLGVVKDVRPQIAAHIKAMTWTPGEIVGEFAAALRLDPDASRLGRIVKANATPFKGADEANLDALSREKTG